MKKLYVIISYSDRTDEEITAAKEELKQLAETAFKEEFELLEPTDGLKRVCSEIDAVMKADMVILAKGAIYSLPCRVVHFAASGYGLFIYEEPDIRDMAKAMEDHDAAPKEDEYPEQS